MKTNLKRVACLSLLATSLWACGEADHDAVQQRIMQSTTTASDAIVDALVLIESSAMVSEYAMDRSCGVDEIDAPSCGELMPSSEMMGAQYDEFADFIGERIFTSDNVESSSGDTVIYLLSGDVVCHPDEFYNEEERQGCIEMVDSAEVRLRANLSGERLDLDLLLGSQQAHPLSMVFAPDEVSISTHLHNLEATLDYIADLVGDEAPELPERLEGELKFGFFIDGDIAKLAFHIDQALGLDFQDEDESFSLDVEAIGEVLSVGIDQVAEQLVASMNLGGFSFSGTFIDDYEMEASDPYDLAIVLAGASGTVNFDPAQERVELSDVGFVNGPLQIAINGEDVINVELGNASGGLLAAALEMQGDDLELTVPGGMQFILEAAMHKVSETFSDFDEWMSDELLSITLDGDANPALLLRDLGGVEVLRGVLTFGSTATGYGAVVEAGMCMEESATPDESQSSTHPFEAMEAAVCAD